MTKNKYNRTKYQILKLLSVSENYYTPSEISDKLRKNLHAIEERLYRLVKYNYIWRKKESRKGYSNRYCYKKLKKKGKRVLAKLEELVQYENETGIEVNLKLTGLHPTTLNGETDKLKC